MSIGLFTVAVVPVAFVISGAYSRIPAVRNYLSSLIRLRGVWGWCFLALVLMPALVLLSVPIRSLLRRQPITARQFPDASLGLIGLVWSSFSISYSSSMPQGKMLAGVDLQCPDCKLVSAL